MLAHFACSNKSTFEVGEADNPHHDEGPELMFGGCATGVVHAGRRRVMKRSVMKMSVMKRSVMKRGEEAETKVPAEGETRIRCTS